MKRTVESGHHGANTSLRVIIDTETSSGFPLLSRTEITNRNEAKPSRTTASRSAITMRRSIVLQLLQASHADHHSSPILFCFQDEDVQVPCMLNR